MPESPYSFAECYNLLDVPPDISWTELKRAYKKKLQKLHPDKIQYDTSIDALNAAEQFKAVRIAFTTLELHYKTYETLPKIPFVSNKTDKSLKADDTNSTFHFRTYTETVPSSPSYTKKRLFPSVFLITAVVAIYYFLTINHENESDSNLNPSKPKPLVANPVVDSPTQVRPGLASVVVGNKTFGFGFGFGSSMTEVMSVQGPPTQQNENVLHYGKSHVVFKDGTVSNWFEHESSPLNISRTAQTPVSTTTENTYTSSHYTLKLIKKGATKADVRIIQGEPMQDLIDVWVYGSSKIYFKDERVVSWINSRPNPLKVE